MDNENFRKIIAMHKDRVYNLAWYMTGSHEDAEDITQEVFIRFWKNLSSVSQPAHKSWLLKTARNACIDQLRRRKRLKPVTIPEQNENSLDTIPDENAKAPDDTYLEAERAEALSKMIVRLPENFREILVMHDIQGMPLKTIAESVQMPLNTVKVYLHRGRKRLLKMLHPGLTHLFE